VEVRADLDEILELRPTPRAVVSEERHTKSGRRSAQGGRESGREF
jgi:hypothetical protein